MSWMDGLKDEFVQCRKFGHAWLEGASFKYRLRGVGSGVAVRCERCSMERVDIYDTAGYLTTRKYFQPDGYSKPEGAERVSGNELNLYALSRLRPAPDKNPLLIAISDKL